MMKKYFASNSLSLRLIRSQIGLIFLLGLSFGAMGCASMSAERSYASTGNQQPASSPAQVKPILRGSY
jgi:hypothetical protein